MEKSANKSSTLIASRKLRRRRTSRLSGIRLYREINKPIQIYLAEMLFLSRDSRRAAGVERIDLP